MGVHVCVQCVYYVVVVVACSLALPVVALFLLQSSTLLFFGLVFASVLFCLFVCFVVVAFWSVVITDHRCLVLAGVISGIVGLIRIPTGWKSGVVGLGL